MIAILKLYTNEFCAILKTGKVESVRRPSKSPKLNAFAERVLLSIKSDCLDQMIMLGEQLLRHSIDEYVEHYYIERTPQGIGNRLIDSVPE